MTLTLTTYTLLITISCCNFFSIALYTQVIREDRDYVANVFLGLFCLVFIVGNLDYIFIDNQYYHNYPALLAIGDVASLLLGPLLYLYALMITNNNHRFKWKYLLHLLPVLVYATWLIPFKLQDLKEQVEQVDNMVAGKVPFPFMIAYYNKIVNLIYIIMTFYIQKNHHSVARQLISTAEENNLLWVRNIVISAFPLYILWSLQNQHIIDRHFFGASNLAFSYYLGYHVIRQKSIYSTLSEDIKVDQVMPTEIKYRNSVLTPEKKRNYRNRIDQLMITEKPFKHKELSLSMLADKVQIKPSYLSQLLNEEYGESFYAFVNRHRIMESKMLLKDKRYANYTILSIAYDAGFNSKSTFNKVFRETVGLSPSEFQKQHAHDKKTEL